MKSSILGVLRAWAGKYARREPLRRISISYYRALLWAVRVRLSRIEGIDSIFYRSGIDTPHFKPGLSDIDVLAVVRSAALDGTLVGTLHELTTGLVDRWPLLNSIVIMTEAEIAEGCTQEHVPYLLLGDYSALLGGPGVPGPADMNNPRTRLSAAMLGSWNMLVYLPRWILDRERAPNVNYYKIFLKMLVFCGMAREEAERTVRCAFDTGGPRWDDLPDLREASLRSGNLEDVYVRIATGVYDALDSAVGAIAGDLPAKDTILLAEQPTDEPARSAERRLLEELSRLPLCAPGRALICGSADGPRGYALFLFPEDGAWDPSSIAVIRAWWHQARSMFADVTEMLEPVIDLPILAGRSSLPAILALDISRKLYCLSHRLLPGLIAPEPRIDRASLELEAKQVLSVHFRSRLKQAARAFRTVLLYRIPTLAIVLRGSPPVFGETLHARLAGNEERLWRPVDALRTILERKGALSRGENQMICSCTEQLIEELADALSASRAGIGS